MLGNVGGRQRSAVLRAVADARCVAGAAVMRAATVLADAEVLLPRHVPLVHARRFLASGRFVTFPPPGTAREMVARFLSARRVWL